VYGKALNGQCKISFKNGNNYEGDFENGMLNGHFFQINCIKKLFFLGKGTFTWANGVKYIGDFFYNKLIGYGRFEWPDGSFYEGEVENGLRDGVGLFVAPDNESSYEGKWAKGLRHGKGKLTFKSGGFYEGDFLNGNKHGKGKMVIL